jgi:hypothetical protein
MTSRLILCRVVDFLSIPQGNSAVGGQGNPTLVHDGYFAGHFFLQIRTQGYRTSNSDVQPRLRCRSPGGSTRSNNNRS